MGTHIVPNLWFDHCADEAAQFYQHALGATRGTRVIYPHKDLPDFQKEFAGETLTIELTVMGQPIVLINAGGEFSPTPANSLILDFDESAGPHVLDDLDRAWQSLGEGGKVLMEIGEYPFSPRFGWVEDRYGFSWQLRLSPPTDSGRSVAACLLFRGSQVGRVEEAADYYAKVFDSPRGSERGAQSSPVAVQLADLAFVLLDDPDGSPEFTEAVSYEVRVDTQEQIDHYWKYLSVVPEAGVCGWGKDPFGVSWQVVPTHIGELMNRPGAYAKLLTMSKIVIAEF